MKMHRNPQVDAWTQNLPSERDRLVRLCARLTGNLEAAEDLAQETLWEAWRHAENLREPGAWRAYVSGIARNVCLRWQRRESRDLSRRAWEGIHTGQEGPTDPFSAALETEAARDPLDVEAVLEQAELAFLLDRAMGSLPSEARELLVERYVDELPQAEMAARRNITENVVGVRIHRAKAALRRVLSSEALRADAAPYGLVDPEAEDGWQETRLWCPRCGNQHLWGRFKSPAEAAETGTPLFAVRCPDCQGALGYDFTSGNPTINVARVLGGVKGFKPALTRLSAWWHNYNSSGLSQGYIACPVCARRAQVTTNPPPGTHPALQQLRGMYISCPSCTKVYCFTPSGVAFHSAQAQAFWRNHPRLRLLEERDAVVEGHPAAIVTLESVTSNARLEIALSRESFDTIRVDDSTTS
jgi:RNA polymerase sigma factor (sigma-70 family)